MPHGTWKIFSTELSWFLISCNSEKWVNVCLCALGLRRATFCACFVLSVPWIWVCLLNSPRNLKSLDDFLEGINNCADFLEKPYQLMLLPQAWIKHKQSAIQAFKNETIPSSCNSRSAKLDVLPLNGLYWFMQVWECVSLGTLAR